MAKKSPIETELLEVTKLKQGPKENRQAFLKKLSVKINDMADEDEKVYSNLTSDTQDWVNASIAAEKADQLYPDFDWQDPVEGTPKKAELTPDAGGEKSETTMLTKKTAKKPTAKKPAAKKAKAPKKAAKATAPAKTAKPKAAKKSNGALGATPPWRRVLAGIAAKGDKGVNREQIFALCEKNEVKPLYARFVGGGYLKRVERGVVAITPAGNKFLADNK